MNSNTIRPDGLRSIYDQKVKIEEDREPIPETFVDILKKKSSIVGVKEVTEKLNFSSLIQKAYVDIQEAFNGRTKVIMEIVASVPDVKIIFLPNQDNIHKYEQNEEPEFILEGITYAKSETIIIAAKGYNNMKSYSKFLGVIIHEFCHFAVHETYGNEFKPYYTDDQEAAVKWKELIDLYKSCNLTEFPLIEDIFNNYQKAKWVEEVIVRYPQFHVEHHNEKDYLQQFEETFFDLHSIFVMNVHKELKTEKVKIASLRTVNEKSLLVKSKLNVNILNVHFKMDLNVRRQIVKTNQTFLVMKNIFDKICNNKKSFYMFISMDFLESDENMRMIENALSCHKITNLVIDGHHNAYDDRRLQEKISNLLNSDHIGRIMLVLHETQRHEENLQIKVHEPIIFNAFHLTESFKGSFKVNFQGSIRHLGSMLNVNQFGLAINQLFESQIFEAINDCKISVGNQYTPKLTEFYVEREFLMETLNNWSEIDLNDGNLLTDIFDIKQCIVIDNESGEGKTTEAIRMFQRMKTTYPNNWVVFLNLFDHISSLLDESKITCMDYLTKNILKIEGMEKEIFLNFVNDGKVIFIFDSLDEIPHEQVENIEKLVVELKSKQNRVCIFTRPIGSALLSKNISVHIKMLVMNREKKRELIDKLLKSKHEFRSSQYERSLEKCCRIFKLNDEAFGNDDNTSNTPLLIKIVTEVLYSIEISENGPTSKTHLLDCYLKKVKGEMEEKKKNALENEMIKNYVLDLSIRYHELNINSISSFQSDLVFSNFPTLL